MKSVLIQKLAGEWSEGKRRWEKRRQTKIESISRALFSIDT